MSLEFDNATDCMVNTLVHALYRGPGDTVQATFYRIEKATKGEVPAKWLKRRWYYRAEPSVPVFFGLLEGYQAVLAAGRDAYNAERMRVPADERFSILVRLAALVAPAEDPPPK